MSDLRGVSCQLGRSALIVMMIAAAPTVAQAQGAAGERGVVSVTGTVVSVSTGAPIVGAAVIVTATGAGTFTDERGAFSLDVAPGTYTIEVSFGGYLAGRLDVVAIAGVAPAALAFQLADDPQYDEVILIVGSRTPRTATQTPVPIDIITADVIEQSGHLEINQVLAAVAPSYNASHQAVADGSDHINPASLRGLGPDQVLVLVNGRRRHSSALTHVNGTFGRGTVGVDLNAIPTAAIARIEVLRDGAAAQYGSDAIAGVVNIVLKDNPGVFDVVATSGITATGDGFEAKTSANYGVRLPRDGVLSVTGEFLQRNPTNRAGEWTADFYPGVEGEAATDAELAANGLDRDDIAMRVGQSRATVGALMFNARQPLEGAELYSFGGLTYRDGEAAGFYRRPNQEDRVVFEFFPNGFLPEIHTGILDWSAGAGVRAGSKRYGLDADVSVNHGGNTFDFRVENSVNASLGVLSPTEFDAGGLAASQTNLNADIIKSVSVAALRKLAIVGGGEYRIENYQIRAGEPASFVLGDETTEAGNPKQAGAQVFPGFQPSNEVNAYRRSVGAYLGVESEISERVVVDAGGRFEHFNDFGNTLIGKVAGRYNVTKRLAVRGAASTGFRAPSLNQVNFNTVSTQFVANDVTGALEPRQVLTAANGSEVAEAFGIPALEEETSFNASAGVTTKPLENLSITADAYYIVIDGRIVLTSQFSEGAVAGVDAILAPFPGVTAAQFFTNAVDTETMGVDVVVDYNTQVSGGNLGLTLSANFTTTEVTAVNVPQGVADRFGAGSDAAISGVLFNREERNRLEDALPHRKGTLAARYARAAYAGLLRVNYYGPIVFKTGNELLDEDFSDKVTVDVDLGYRLPQGFKVSIGAINLLNTFPDEQENPDNKFNNQFIYSRRVSQFGINGGFYYLRLQYSL